MRYSDIFKKCPQCGNPLSVENERMVSCPHGDFTFYINPAPCNAVVIENEQHEILLVKRKFEPRIGAWDLPGGFVDPGESAEDSVRREIKEELRCDIENIRYLTSYHDVYDFKGITYNTLGFIFVGELHGIITPSDDITSYAFFPLDQVPYESLAFTSTKKAVDDYRARLSSA